MQVVRCDICGKYVIGSTWEGEHKLDLVIFGSGRVELCDECESRLIRHMKKMQTEKSQGVFDDETH